MDITREQACAIIKYLLAHPVYYFPFSIMNQEYGDDDDDYNEITREDFINVLADDGYATFQLRENLQDLDKDTVEQLAQGFLMNMGALPPPNIISSLKDELVSANISYEETINDTDFIGEGRAGTEDETFEWGYVCGIEKALCILGVNKPDMAPSIILVTNPNIPGEKS